MVSHQNIPLRYVVGHGLETFQRTEIKVLYFQHCGSLLEWFYTEQLQDTMSILKIRVESQFLVMGLKNVIIAFNRL